MHPLRKDCNKTMPGTNPEARTAGSEQTPFYPIPPYEDMAGSYAPMPPVQFLGTISFCQSPSSECTV